MNKSSLTDEQRASLGLIAKRTHSQALIEHHQALVRRRIIPEPWTTIPDILKALEQRLLSHDRGLAGVADELGVGRKNLWRWLRGMKIPDNGTLSKMARVLQSPPPTMRHAVEVKTGISIPPRASYRFRGEGRTSKWRFMLDMKPGDYFEAEYRHRNNILGFAKSNGFKLVTRVLSRDKIGVWRT